MLFCFGNFTDFVVIKSDLSYGYLKLKMCLCIDLVTKAEGSRNSSWPALIDIGLEAQSMDFQDHRSPGLDPLLLAAQWGFCLGWAHIIWLFWLKPVVHGSWSVCSFSVTHPILNNHFYWQWLSSLFYCLLLISLDCWCNVSNSAWHTRDITKKLTSK